jgi:hypothetical protein
MRTTWPLPADEELKSHIQNYHHASADERLERYKFIWQEFGPPVDMLLAGGIQAYLALEELRLCFMDGYYLATVLLAQIFIENSLGGSYIISGDDKLVEKGFSKLIDQALADNLIDSSLAAQFHQLRRMRNPYVHPKAGTGPGSIMGRMLEKYRDGKVYDSPEELAREDAEQAVRTVVDFLRYTRRDSDQPWTP